MPETMAGAMWAFGWGVAAASGAFVGAILGLMTRLRHRAIAALMSLGAGVLLSAASFKVASEALVPTGAGSTTAGMIAGAATFVATRLEASKSRLLQHNRRLADGQDLADAVEKVGLEDVVKS